MQKGPPRLCGVAEVVQYVDRSLEGKLSGELNNTSRISACDIARVGIAYTAVDGVIAARAAGGETAYVSGVLSMVKGIERADVQFEIDTLCDVEGLAELHVPIVDAGLAQEVSARISIDA